MRGASTFASTTLPLLLALAGVLATTADCTSPGAPTDALKDYRYEVKLCEGEPDPPDQGGGEPTFAAIYRDLISVHGVAKCQDSTCHGGNAGQADLSMGTDQKGAYCGLLCFQAILIPNDAALYASCGCPDLAPKPGEVDVANADYLLQTVGYDPVDGQMSPGSMPNATCLQRDPTVQFPKNRKLNAAEKKRIEAWAKAGAKNDGSSAPVDSGVGDAAGDAPAKDSASSD